MPILAGEAARFETLHVGAGGQHPLTLVAVEGILRRQELNHLFNGLQQDQ